MTLKRTTAFTAAVLLGVAVWWAFRSPDTTRLETAQENPVVPASAPAAPLSPPRTTEKPGSLSQEDSAATVTAKINDAVALLAASPSPEAAREILRNLRVALAALPPEVASKLIQGFLAGGKDAATPLQFTISQAGQLTEAPSLRVWLLDCLGQTNPEAAADYARTILATSGSPDEWAVSLRDYARVRESKADVDFIHSKVREMIHNPAWQDNPTTGYLEAFDTIVYTRGTNLTADLAQLITKKEKRAVAHAAYLTLDRLVIQDTLPVLSHLAGSPEAMQGREQTRANYFARADVRNPQQRTLLETYLLDASRTPVELQTFSGIYPNANMMISNNLLTTVHTPVQADLKAHDREALTVVESWIQDPRFSKILPHLEQMRSRLEAFVQQAAQ